MKKILSMILAVLMLATCMNVFVGAAPETPNITAIFSDLTGEKGDTVTLTVNTTVADGVEFAGIELEFSYDDTVLELVDGSISYQQPTNAALAYGDKNQSAPIIYYSAMSMSGNITIKDEALLTAQFTIVGEPGTYDNCFALTADKGFSYADESLTAYTNADGYTAADLPTVTVEGEVVASTTVYVDQTSGLDTNNGLTAATAVNTLAAAQAIIDANDAITTVKIIGTYTTVANESIGGVTLTGNDTDSTFAVAASFMLSGDLTIENINLSTASEYPFMVGGYDVTFGEGVTGSFDVSNYQYATHQTAGQIHDSTITIDSGTFGSIIAGVGNAGDSPIPYLGKTTLVVNDGTVGGIYFGKGQNIALNKVQHFYGTLEIEINGGTVSDVALMSSSWPQGAAVVKGLRYITLNEGTLTTANTHIPGKRRQAGNTGHVEITASTGLTVYELNGGTFGGTFYTRQYDAGTYRDQSERVIILNGSHATAAYTIADAYAKVIKPTGATLKAVAVEPTEANGWASSLTGLTYTLADPAYNMVTVNETEYMLADLTDGVIPATDIVAGENTVVFSTKTVAAEEYTVKFMDGETQLSTVTGVEGTEVTAPADPEKDGYTFVGWNTDANATEAGEVITAIGTADVTYYAIWEAETPAPTEYTVKFMDGETQLSTVTGVEGTAVTAPADPEKDGYTFVGWNTDADATEAGEVIATIGTANVTYYAIWQKNAAVDGEIVYVDQANGLATNNGLTAATAVNTLAVAQAIIDANDAITTVKIIGKYTCVANESIGGVTVTGNTGAGTDSIVSVWNGLTATGDLVFDDISLTINGDHTFQACGHDITFTDKTVATGAFLTHFAAGDPGTAVYDATITLNGGSIGKVNLGVYGKDGATDNPPAVVYHGKSKVVLNGDAAITNGIYTAHGFNTYIGKDGNLFGTVEIELNDNASVGTITFNASARGGGQYMKGLRYVTLNGGTVGSIVTNIGAKFAKNSTGSWRYLGGQYITMYPSTGVTVFEVNDGATITNTALGMWIFDGEEIDAARDESTRVMILNGKHADIEYTTSDTALRMVKVKGGTLKAVATEPTLENGWASELTGFSYALADSTYDTVTVNDTVFALADLADNLIPASAVVAGNNTVVFSKSGETPAPTQYTVTFMDGTTKLSEVTVNAGTAITAPTDLAKDGYTFKGWAESEGGAVVAPITTATKTVTYYAVWEEIPAPVSKTIYVDQANGVDTNDGTTVATAVKTFAQAETLGADIIKLVGEYTMAGGETLGGYKIDGNTGNADDIIHATDAFSLDGDLEVSNITLDITAENAVNMASYDVIIGEGVVYGDKSTEASFRREATGTVIDAEFTIESGSFPRYFLGAYRANATHNGTQRITIGGTSSISRGIYAFEGQTFTTGQKLSQTFNGNIYIDVKDSATVSTIRFDGWSDFRDSEIRMNGLRYITLDGGTVSGDIVAVSPHKFRACGVNSTISAASTGVTVVQINDGATFGGSFVTGNDWQDNTLIWDNSIRIYIFNGKHADATYSNHDANGGRTIKAYGAEVSANVSEATEANEWTATLNGYNYVLNADNADADYAKVVTRLGNATYYKLSDYPTLPADAFLAGVNTVEFVNSEDVEVTVKFMMNDGTETAVSTQDIYKGQAVTEPAAPTRENYEFLGWSTDANATVAGTVAATADADTTYYAVWKRLAATYTFYLDEYDTVYTTLYFDYDTAVGVPETDPTRTNYIFGGWTATKGGTEVVDLTGVTAAEDRAFYAIWTTIVADAAVIDTKVTYNEATDTYTANIYFKDAEAYTVAFGYDYDAADLEFVSFEPATANGISVFKTGDGTAIYEVNTSGKYENVVTREAGKIDGMSADGVLIGTLNFKYIGAEYFDADADYLTVASPTDAVEDVTEVGYFLYTTDDAEDEYTIVANKIVFSDIEVETAALSDATITLNFAREGAPVTFATATVYTKDGQVYTTGAVEDADDGASVTATFRLVEGETYYIVVEKTSYLTHTTEEFTVNGTVDLGEVDMLAGDIAPEGDNDGDGAINFFDFARVVAAFEEAYDEAYDLNEDGDITVADLALINANYLGAYAD